MTPLCSQRGAEIISHVGRQEFGLGEAPDCSGLLLVGTTAGTELLFTPGEGEVEIPADSGDEQCRQSP